MFGWSQPNFIGYFILKEKKKQVAEYADASFALLYNVLVMLALLC
jgi:hypothetical protein